MHTIGENYSVICMADKAIYRLFAPIEKIRTKNSTIAASAHPIAEIGAKSSSIFLE